MGFGRCLGWYIQAQLAYSRPIPIQLFQGELETLVMYLQFGWSFWLLCVTLRIGNLPSKGTTARVNPGLIIQLLPHSRNYSIQSCTIPATLGSIPISAVVLLLGGLRV